MESNRDVLMSDNELILSQGCQIVVLLVTEIIIFTTLCLTIGAGSWVRFSGGLAVWEFWYVSLSQLDRRQQKSIWRTSFKTAWRSFRRKIDKNLVLVLIDLLCILWSNIYILNLSWPKHKLSSPLHWWYFCTKSFHANCLLFMILRLWCPLVSTNCPQQVEMGLCD